MSVVTESLSSKLITQEEIQEKVVGVVCKVCDIAREQLPPSYLDLPLRGDPFYIGADPLGSGEFLDLNFELKSSFGIPELSPEEIYALQEEERLGNVITIRSIAALIGERLIRFAH